MASGTGKIDVVFVVDTTGSMGSQITTVQQNLVSMLDKIKALSSATRFGLVGYKDHCDLAVVTVHVPLTDDLEVAKKGVAEMSASGGGDYPEAVADGLHSLVRLNWRADSAKTAVLIADAPPHGVGGAGDAHPKGCPCGEDWLEQVESCREMGITIHTVACSGMNEIAVWEKIATETWGKLFHLSNVCALPELITGVAECDLDRLRVKAAVMQLLQESLSTLQKMNDEEEKINHLCERMLERRETVLFKETASSTAVPKSISKLDIEQAISSLKKSLDPTLDVSALFPRTGALPYCDKGGLYSTKTQTPVPLTDVQVNATIIGFCCEVEIVQKYVNISSSPLEAVYKFPIDDLAVVVGFIAEIDNKRIIAKCTEKEKAAAIYDDAIASGHGAYLLEQKKSDLFNMSVGNLPPGKTVTIRITYVSMLESEEHVLRFVLPMTIAPRYQESYTLPSIEDSPEKGKEKDDGVTTTTTTSTVATEREEGALTGKAPYRIKISLTIQMSQPLDIKDVASLSHKIVVSQNSENIVRVDTVQNGLNADFVLLITERNPRNQTFIETWETTETEPKCEPLAVTSICPSFSPIFDPTVETTLFIVIDCSSSMYGRKMEMAILAAQRVIALLEAAPPVTKFQVSMFGSDCHSLFTTPESTTDSSARNKAITAISSLLPDKGGSQLMKALKNVAQQTGTKKAVLLLSDGALSRSEELKSWAKQETQISVFPIGIGYGVNQSLLRDLACTSKGHASFCTPEEQIQAKVTHQMQRIFCSVRDPTIGWLLSTKQPLQGLQLPLPIVISQNRVTSFALLSPDPSEQHCPLGHSLVELEGSPSKCSLCGKGEDAPKKHCVDCRWFLCTSCAMNWGLVVYLTGRQPNGESLCEAASVDLHSAKPGKMFHQLYAKNLIRAIENSTFPEATKKATVIQLATTYNVSSSYTSFIAVEERTSPTEESMERVEVPSCIPSTLPAKKVASPPAKPDYITDTSTHSSSSSSITAAPSSSASSSSYESYSARTSAMAKDYAERSYCLSEDICYSKCEAVRYESECVSYAPTMSLARASKKSAACFIATAAYGSELDHRISVLRDFRDKTLSQYLLGRAFISTYYTVSPPIASWISDKEWVRWIVRLLLAPIVFTLETLHYGKTMRNYDTIPVVVCIVAIVCLLVLFVLGI
ncbi:von Willebrand factor type A domain protein [Pelomyxa schiedti]|nr:von Willebrand factor type A domain protein [Pelomyxa schiedti]